MILKNKEFWDCIENDLAQDDSELIALHCLFTLKTYRYITGDITNLIVSPIHYQMVSLIAEDVVKHSIPKVEYEKLNNKLFSLVIDFKQKGTKVFLKRALEYLKSNPTIPHLIAVSGTLEGILNTQLIADDYLLVCQVDRALNNILQGKEVDDIG